MAAVEATFLFGIVWSEQRTLQVLLTTGCLVAALLLGAIVVAAVQRWRRRAESMDDVSPTAQLAHFRSLYEAGTISQEEFERLRSLLGGRMRDSLGVPAPRPPQPAQPPGHGDSQPPPPPDSGIRPA
jgi:hypothetical protein